MTWRIGRAGRRVAIGITIAGVVAAHGITTVKADVTAQPCPGPISGGGDLPVPPVGYVSLVQSTLGNDCTVQTGAVEIVPADSPLLTLGVNVAPVDQQPIEDNLAAAANSYSYATTATVHQRLWDCCGFLLNEFDTSLYWQYNYGSVGGSSAHNAASYHVENGSCWPNYSGWYVSGQNIYYSGGGYGQSNVRVTGNMNFGYEGRFSNCYNVNPWTKYTNNMTGYANGGWYCQYSWWWASGYPGWHTQNWCGYGN